MDEPLVDTELADSEPQRRSGPWKMIIAVAVLTLIGVWLVPDNRTDVPKDAYSTAPPRAYCPSPLDRHSMATRASLSRRPRLVRMPGRRARVPAD